MRVEPREVLITKAVDATAKGLEVTLEAADIIEWLRSKGVPVLDGDRITLEASRPARGEPNPEPPTLRVRVLTLDAADGWCLRRDW